MRYKWFDIDLLISDQNALPVPCRKTSNVIKTLRYIKNNSTKICDIAAKLSKRSKLWK